MSWADHEGVHYDGPAPVISHYNNQFDVVYGAILQLMRTGDFTWFDVADPLARHVIDIDVYHTQLDKPAYNGGLFWFTDHYLDAATSTHRTYSRANQPEGGPYGGGPGSEHNFATGLLYYYYLTGSTEAAETVLGLADWVINMDDGGLDMLGILDDGPTGRASICGGDQFPGRGAANSISVLLDAWQLSRDDRYMRAAEALIRRNIHPHDDLASLDLLNAEKRWSYTMFLASVVKYLSVNLEWKQTHKMFSLREAKSAGVCRVDGRERTTVLGSSGSTRIPYGGLGSTRIPQGERVADGLAVRVWRKGEPLAKPWGCSCRSSVAGPKLVRYPPLHTRDRGDVGGGHV